MIKEFVKLTFGEMELYSKPPILSVPPTTPISEALTLLAINKFLHLPITSHHSSKIHSIVGTLDIVTYLTQFSLDQLPTRLNHSIEQTLTLDPDDESYLVWERDIRDILEEVRSFSNQFNNIGRH